MSFSFFMFFYLQYAEYLPLPAKKIQKKIAGADASAIF